MIDLRLGDCLEVMDDFIKKSIKYDCVFTSPPYNSKRFKKYKNFKDDYNCYYTFLTTVTDKMLKLSDKVIFNLQANYYNRNDVYKFIGEYSKNIQRIIIWNKSNPAPSSLRNRLTNAHEYFIVMTNGQTIETNSVYVKDVINFPINSKRIKGHSAVMNEDVCRFFISEFTKKEDNVLDVFLGSGTTGIVCYDLERNFTGVEMDEEYFKIAEKRIKEKIKEKEFKPLTLFN
jgi:DNA modification methylase